MINLMVGAPGGGKSYEACVYHILPALQRGRKVITNLPVNVDVYAALDESYRDLLELRRMPQPVRGTWAAGTDGPAYKVDGELKPQPVTTRLFSTVWDYWTDWRHPKTGQGPLFVIDEAQLAVPKGKVDPHVAEWYSLHRHYNCDVLLITQAYGRMDPAIRDLVQLCYRVRKAIAFGFKGKYIRKVQDGIRGEVVNTTARTYESKYFKLYTSHTQGRSVDEDGASDTKAMWKSWPFLGAGICFLYAVISYFNGTFDNLIKAPAPAAKPVAQSVSGMATQAVASVSGAPAVTSPAAAADVPPDPFAALGVHLVGSLQSARGAVYRFVVSQQGLPLFALSDSDLVEMGFAYRSLGHCAGLLTLGKTQRTVVCDAPQVALVASPRPTSGKAPAELVAGGAGAVATGGHPLAGGTRGERSEP